MMIEGPYGKIEVRGPGDDPFIYQVKNLGLTMQEAGESMMNVSHALTNFSVAYFNQTTTKHQENFANFFSGVVT